MDSVASATCIMRNFPAFLLIVLGLFIHAKAQCNGVVDLIIAIPSGYQLPNAEFNSFETNIIEVMYHFNIEPGQFNIGLLRYGKQPTVFSSPQPFKSRPQVNTRITLMTQRNATDGIQLDVAKAILAMDKMAHTPSEFYPPSILRGNAKKYGIIFTYKDTTKGRGVAAAANIAKANGMVLHVVRATGSNASSPPYGSHFHSLGTDDCRVFSVNSYETGLRFLIPDLASTICSELDPATWVTKQDCRPRIYPKAGRFSVTCSRLNNMVQPDPNNCAYFFRCDYYNTVPRRLPCPSGTLYDPYTGVCNFARDVACYTDLQCPTDIPMLYPHPLDCQKYINCDRHFVPHVQSCPYGSMFDPDWQTCNDTSQITCILPRV